jgi:hypothetical protein
VSKSCLPCSVVIGAPCSPPGPVAAAASTIAKASSRRGVCIECTVRVLNSSRTDSAAGRRRREEDHAEPATVCPGINHVTYQELRRIRRESRENILRTFLADPDRVRGSCTRAEPKSHAAKAQLTWPVIGSCLAAQDGWAQRLPPLRGAAEADRSRSPGFDGTRGIGHGTYID